MLHAAKTIGEIRTIAVFGRREFIKGLVGLALVPREIPNGSHIFGNGLSQIGKRRAEDRYPWTSKYKGAA